MAGFWGTRLLIEVLKTSFVQGPPSCSICLMPIFGLERYLNLDSQKHVDVYVILPTFCGFMVLANFEAAGCRIGSVGASCFVDDLVSCWSKWGVYRLLLEPS